MHRPRRAGTTTVAISSPATETRRNAERSVEPIARAFCALGGGVATQQVFKPGFKGAQLLVLVGELRLKRLHCHGFDRGNGFHVERDPWLGLVLAWREAGHTQGCLELEGGGARQRRNVATGEPCG